MKIAISGKGGVGKTTVAANLIYLFAKNGFDVFAVDADPDASLGLALGVDPQKLEKLTPLADMEDIIAEKSGGKGAFYNLDPDVEDVVDDYSLQQGRVKFLIMGGIKQAGTACYCRESSFLNAVLNSLLLDKKEVVVLDMSAGIEHLTRGTARGVDMVLIVTEPTRTSLKTTGVVKRLADDLGVKEVKILGNKIRRPEEEKFLKDNFSPDEFIGVLPFEEKVWEDSMADSAAGFAEEDLLNGVEIIYQKISAKRG
ncbi:MAG: AAA family ATPase [Firmicutes bacterium]|nr:AAA family ATPase [Bacillota bacterium]